MFQATKSSSLVLLRTGIAKQATACSRQQQQLLLRQQQQSLPRVRLKSSKTLHPKLQQKSKPFLLEADAGALSTRFYHATCLLNAVLFPAYFFVPDSYTDGLPNKLFGLFLTANVAAHGWIGMNYIAVDYVPKISKALLLPFRYLNLGVAVVTMLGLGKIALTSPGGIKAVVKGVWNPPDDATKNKKKDGEFEY